jgi:hypothetical protein
VQSMCMSRIGNGADEGTLYAVISGTPLELRKQPRDGPRMTKMS